MASLIREVGESTIALVKGFGVTMKNMLRKTVTENYPHQPVNSRLGPEVAICVFAIDFEGRVLDSSAVARLEVGQHEVHPRASEGLCDAQADALRGTCHDRGLSV